MFFELTKLKEAFRIAGSENKRAGKNVDISQMNYKHNAKTHSNLDKRVNNALMEQDKQQE